MILIEVVLIDTEHHIHGIKQGKLLHVQVTLGELGKTPRRWAIDDLDEGREFLHVLELGGVRSSSLGPVLRRLP